jgi:uncharacterized membrane protein YfcA
MLKVLKIDPQIAIGTNMTIGCITAFTGAISSWALIPQKTSLAFYSTILIVPPSILGGYLGAKMINRFSTKQLTLIIGLLIILVGILMIAQGFWHIFASLDI